MAASLRECITACVDDARKIVEDLDLRPYEVIIRTRTWSGAERGQGTKTDVDVIIDPRPLVKYPTPRLIANAPGKYESGDRMVSKVTRTLLESQLTADAALIATDGATVERFYLINGDTYRLVGEPELRNFEWKLQLRRMRQR